jgi:hypothetical protein
MKQLERAHSSDCRSSGQGAQNVRAHRPDAAARIRCVIAPGRSWSFTRFGQTSRLGLRRKICALGCCLQYTSWYICTGVAVVAQRSSMSRGNPRSTDCEKTLGCGRHVFCGTDSQKHANKLPEQTGLRHSLPNADHTQTLPEDQFHSGEQKDLHILAAGHGACSVL